MGIIEEARPRRVDDTVGVLRPGADVGVAIQGWHTRSADAPPMLAIPTDRPRGPDRGLARAARSVALPSPAWEDVAELAARERVDPGAVLLAAFLAVVHRYARESDILAAVAMPGGEPVARSHGEGVPETVILLRLDIVGDLPFQELVQRVHEENVRAAGEARVPLACLAQLQDAMAADGRPGIAHVAFRWGEGSHDGPAIGTWGVDLALVCQRLRGGLTATIDYSRDLFDASTVDRLLDHLQVLLGGAVRDSARAVGALPLITDRELALQAGWNATDVEYPTHTSVVELVQQRAAEMPQATAVEDERVALTYEEVDRRANQLGAFLRARGVGPESLVALFVDRSVDMIVAVLGVHRAGGAYLPIDPAYPSERIAFMLADSAASVVMTQERLRPRLPEYRGLVVSLDGADAAAIADRPAIAPAIEAGSERLAYVIYTSGSTGRPKGVQIAHRNVMNFLTGMTAAVRMRPGDTILALASLSFDISVNEMFLPLTSGARLLVASRETAANPKALVALIERGRVTHLQATPSTWRMLLDAGWRGRPGLVAMCGGEGLPQPLADELVRCGLELWNLYGPTEATVWATIHRQSAPGVPVRIGRPMANVTAYILDARLAPVPVGVPGELALGGQGLARGYHNRQELTAERFIAHPLRPSSGERVYRTGDLARWHSDGTLEFLGRTDHQVKLRGYRIELGEVEAVLVAHPGVRAAVAVVREDSPGDPRMVGYVTVDTGAAVTPSSLRRALLEKLPPHMVPDAIVVLGAMPLNASGKIDRKQLPPPSFGRATEGGEGRAPAVAPRTPLQARLVAIWEDVLNVRPIGVTDDFFDLGVTSITAARLFERVERDLGATLPLSPLFQAPTVERLSALIEGGRGERRWTSLVPIQPQGTKTPIFCVHGGAGTILHFQPLAKRLGTDQPFYGLQMQGLYGDAPTHVTVEQMAAHYLEEIRSVQPSGPYLLAGYCFGSIPAFEMARRLEQEGERVALLVAINGPSPAYIGTYGSGARRQAPSDQQTQRATTPSGWMARARVAATGVPRAVARSKLAIRFLSIWGRVHRKTIRTLTKLYAAHGRPLPNAWREDAIFSICGVAERRYRPRVYGGKMMVFRGADLYKLADLGWGDFVSGGIDAYEVPGEQGNQRSAMREPFVGFIADRLREGFEACGVGSALPQHESTRPS